ncbi:MAG: M48 family metallopeptidase [Thiomargarita sp.]|nr:M48 family metallopeptidase [Thiomargarita sp.]
MRYWYFILWLIYMPCTAIELPNMGLSADTILSPAEEKKLGETFFRQLRRKVKVIDDPQINAYINTLGHRLASYSDHPEQHFRFFVIDEPSINAFAVPGGFIGIHSGLILKTRAEGELASVIAHEISHVTRRHIARTLEASKNLSIPVLAGLIAGAILAASTGSGQIGQATIATAMASQVQMQIHFTNIHEKEADRVGMQILANSGFDPNTMPLFFNRLQEANRYYDRDIPDFLRTHPVTTDRIAEALSRASQYQYQQTKQDDSYYHLAKAQLLTLVTDNKIELLKKLTNMLEIGNYRDERATRYAIAKLLIIIGNTDNVQQQIDWLVKHDHDRLSYRLLKAQFALMQQDVPKAMLIYSQALQLYPNNEILSLEYAEKLLQYNQAETAKTILLNISPNLNPHYYYLLAQTYQSLGNLAESHLALAESYYLLGRNGIAIEQLKLARKQAKNMKQSFYLISRINARSEEWKQELLEEQKAPK